MMDIEFNFNNLFQLFGWSLSQDLIQIGVNYFVVLEKKLQKMKEENLDKILDEFSIKKSTLE